MRNLIAQLQVKYLRPSLKALCLLGLFFYALFAYKPFGFKVYFNRTLGKFCYMNSKHMPYLAYDTLV